MKQSIILGLFLVCLSGEVSAFLGRFKHRHLSKRPSEVVTKRSGKGSFNSKLFFKGEPLDEYTFVKHNDTLTLECEVGGSPSPTIHWLKDGEIVPQGWYHTYEDFEATYEDKEGVGGSRLLRMASTGSKLHVDCLTRKSQGVYTCVAETPYIRISQSTKVRLGRTSLKQYEKCLVKKSLRGDKPRIYLWTVSRLEFEGATVQLMCRAEGTPKPEIVWFDRNNDPITEDSEQFKVLKNGDLMIRQISWGRNMGLFTCLAKNRYGTDRKGTFLYPTMRDTDTPF